MLILEGKQGLGKSSAIRTLAGGDANFSDQPLQLHDPKAQQETLSGVWLYELSELEGVRKAEVETIKAFITQTTITCGPSMAGIAWTGDGDAYSSRRQTRESTTVICSTHPATGGSGQSNAKQ